MQIKMKGVLKTMTYISSREYAEKYGLPQCAVAKLSRLDNSPFNIRVNGTHVYVEDKVVKLITVNEYAKKFKISEHRVRELTKSEAPPFEVYFAGTKAYIKVDDEDKEHYKIRKVANEVEELKLLVIKMCKHFGVNVDDVITNSIV